MSAIFRKEPVDISIDFPRPGNDAPSYSPGVSEPCTAVESKGDDVHFLVVVAGFNSSASPSMHDFATHLQFRSLMGRN